MTENFTVIIDDDCGTTKAYYLPATTASGAAAAALRIFNAHASVNGSVLFVFLGEPVFCDFTGGKSQAPPAIIHLYQTDEDPA